MKKVLGCAFKAEERPRLEIEIWKLVCGWWWMRWSREKAQKGRRDRLG